MKEPNIGKKLIEVRKANGLTQEEVAEKCRITVRTIQRIESGQVTPRAFTVKILSEALGHNFFEPSDTGSDGCGKEADADSKRRTLWWYVNDLFNLKTHAMKKVTILTTFFVTVAFSLFIFVSETSAQSAESRKMPNYVKTKDRIEVCFSNDFTFDSLVYVKNDLKDRGIAVNYKSMSFDDNNRLQSISVEVDCNDGYSGSFTVGRLNSENKGKRLGFYRDYSTKDGSPFGTGLLEK